MFASLKAVVATVSPHEVARALTGRSGSMADRLDRAVTRASATPRS